ncbi:hypothetical protein [Rhizobium sp. Nf11,1]|uniref:hypothetical protein n=1 Tax=unclassified Rhizobium TaxID=2613769 RepID=UPI003D32DB33
MSRYTITVAHLASQTTDADAVIGYDRPLQTFFLQAFPDAEGEDLALWLGTDLRAYETLSALRTAALAQGYDFIPMATDTVRSLANDLAREGWRSHPDPLLEALLSHKTAPT